MTRRDISVRWCDVRIWVTCECQVCHADILCQTRIHLHVYNDNSSLWNIHLDQKEIKIYTHARISMCVMNWENSCCCSGPLTLYMLLIHTDMGFPLHTPLQCSVSPSTPHSSSSLNGQNSQRKSDGWYDSCRPYKMDLLLHVLTSVGSSMMCNSSSSGIPNSYLIIFIFNIYIHISIFIHIVVYSEMKVMKMVIYNSPSGSILSLFLYLFLMLNALKVTNTATNKVTINRMTEVARSTSSLPEGVRWLVVDGEDGDYF